MVICLKLSADLHMAQRVPLPLTVSCFSKIQIGFTFLVPGSPGKRAVKHVCVCVLVISLLIFTMQSYARAVCAAVMCPSVPPSVTSWYYIKITGGIELVFG